MPSQQIDPQPIVTPTVSPIAPSTSRNYLVLMAGMFILIIIGVGVVVYLTFFVRYQISQVEGEKDSINTDSTMPAMPVGAQSPNDSMGAVNQVAIADAQTNQQQMIETAPMQVTQKSATYSDNTLGFSMTIPPGWFSQKNTANGKTNLLLTPVEIKTGDDLGGQIDTIILGFGGSWTADIDTAVITPQEYVQVKMEHYERYPDKITQKVIMLDGAPAHFRRNLLPGAQIANIFTIHNHREFNIMYMPKDGNWSPDDEATLDAVVASFKFTD